MLHRLHDYELGIHRALRKRFKFMHKKYSVVSIYFLPTLDSFGFLVSFVLIFLLLFFFIVLKLSCIFTYIPYIVLLDSNKVLSLFRCFFFKFFCFVLTSNIPFLS